MINYLDDIMSFILFIILRGRTSWILLYLDLFYSYVGVCEWGIIFGRFAPHLFIPVYLKRICHECGFVCNVRLKTNVVRLHKHNTLYPKDIGTKLKRFKFFFPISKTFQGCFSMDSDTD